MMVSRMARAGFVPGEPAVFLGKGEREWKAAVQSTGVGTIRHPHLDFVVSSFKRRGHYFDIENLAKPVLDVVGAGAEMLWVTMREGQQPGVEICDERPPLASGVVFSTYVAAPPTRSIRQAPPPELLAAPALGTDEPLGLELRFDSAACRVWDCGFEGPIKALIDACGSMLGTYYQGARDYRIRELRVRRGTRVGAHGVHMGFWFL
jgi:hypothetical protein